MKYFTDKKNERSALQLLINNYCEKYGLENTKVYDIKDIIDKDKIEVITESLLPSVETDGHLISTAMIDRDGEIYNYEEYIRLSREKQEECKLVFILLRDMQLLPHFIFNAQTGGGKTTGGLMSTVKYLTQRKNKSSLFVSTTKSDLDYVPVKLKELGYKTYVINCADSFCSNTVNLFASVILLEEERAALLEDVVKINSKPYENYVLKSPESSFKDYFYSINNLAFASKKEAEIYIQNTLCKIEEEIESHFKNLAFYIIPSEQDDKNRHFTDSAQQLLIGAMFIMLEKFRNKRNEFTKEMMNLLTLNGIVSELRSQSVASYRTSTGKISILKGCKKAQQILGKYLEDADSTKRNYFSVLDAQISKLCNENVYELTIGGDEINLDDTDQPVAIFFRAREYSSTDEAFSSLLVETIYRALCIRRESIEVKGGHTCARPFNFILDECANMAPILDLDRKLAVGRSNRLYFHLYLQNYEQLEHKYKNSSTIFSNSTHIFMGSSSIKSKLNFCEHAGNKMIPAQVDFEINPSATLNLIKVPAISVSEIEQLPPYTALMKTRNDVFKISFIPSYCYDKNMGERMIIRRKDSPQDYQYICQQRKSEFDDDDDFF